MGSSLGDALVTAPGAPDAGAPKRAFRTWARAARRALRRCDVSGEVDAVLAAIRAFAPYGRAVTVGSYLAFGDEIDLAPLHTDAGKRFAVPRTYVDGERRMTFHPLAGARLERHPFGQLEPAADDPLVAPEAFDLILVPGLAFDHRGVRLGQGMGFYDRYLATLPEGTVTVGVGFEALVVAALPCEDHDVRVTHLVTECGVRAVGP